MIRDGKRQIYRLKYEKLPDWCAVCGMLGHKFKEHGNGIHPPSSLVFKDLRASWVMRTGQGREVVEAVEAARWIALARVHSPKTYSQYWFFKNMRAAWDLAQEVQFKPLEDNLYTVQFSCLDDWERVTRDGPWHFRGDAVIIKPYDGLAKPSTVLLDTIEIWLQIHDVPPLYAHLVPSLAAKVGEVLYAEP